MQLSLFPTNQLEQSHFPTLARSAFSHGSVCRANERIALEMQYGHLLEETTKFSRKLVSYQGNKGELVHSWLRYREGFSADLVEILIREFGLTSTSLVLDPFAGSATTLLVARYLGINATGIEILPVCHLAWEAKSKFYDYDVDELKSIQQRLQTTSPTKTTTSFPHVAITQGAFSDETENDLMFFTQWIEALEISEQSKTLCRLLLTSILEEISYTRKDGQYLRWDSRSAKVQNRNLIRLAQGKEATRSVDLGTLPAVSQSLIAALDVVIRDIQKLQTLNFPTSRQQFLHGSALSILPTMPGEQFDAVITSPPYCNRYDYTRTYALELAYLGVGDGIFALRQEQLSCTVENRPKLENLRAIYHALGETERFAEILSVIQSNPALNEVNAALQVRMSRGDLNNRGVLAMVEQYFTELAFVFAEIYRTCKPGACIAFVNDNVRYGGEVIPVDLLTTHLAEALGFEPVKVYVLPQRKGNSSQQMSKFGREALRKSITIWRKPGV